MKCDTITHPPPSWYSQQITGSKGQDIALQQSSQKGKDTIAQLDVPVLGADIIAKQFGDKPKPGHVAPSNQGTPTHPTDSTKFGFPPQRRPFNEQGHPPPENQHPDHDRRGMPPHSGPPPYDHFGCPLPYQREWQGKGPPPGREFGHPEFQCLPPPGGEFNQPSPYSWQRSRPPMKEDFPNRGHPQSRPGG